MYCVYMPRCRDDSIYTGYTPDLRARMEEHFSGGPKGSKYVRSRGAKKLEVYWETEEKTDAMKLEYRIKRKLSKEQKEQLILHPEHLDRFFGEDFNQEKYMGRRENE